MKENMFNIGKVFKGYIGGNYEYCGLYETKVDAERGYIPDCALHEIFSEFDGKKIEITIKVIEE